MTITTINPQANHGAMPNDSPPAGPDHPAATGVAHTHGVPAAGPDFRDDQAMLDAHSRSVVAEQTPPATTKDVSPRVDPSLADQAQPGANRDALSTRPPPLADPFLALLADMLDDLERTRIANENRLRQLTRVGVDKDGEERGFGLDESHPDVARLAAIVSTLAKLEHDATLNLQRAIRKHPLGPWVKAQKGIGEKQAARLLAVIGDPFWHTLDDRPRSVSELWAYSGYHVLPASQNEGDTQCRTAGGDQAGDADHQAGDTQQEAVGVAARRRKNQRANWSTTAKMRAYNIAESCMKAGGPYREVYDKRKAHTEGRTHGAPCAPCGTKGNPAPVGTEWRDGHRHADALRITAKEILKDLWREAKRLHEHGSGQEVMRRPGDRRRCRQASRHPPRARARRGHPKLRPEPTAVHTWASRVWWLSDESRAS